METNEPDFKTLSIFEVFNLFKDERIFCSNECKYLGAVLGVGDFRLQKYIYCLKFKELLDGMNILKLSVRCNKCIESEAQ
jgi:hypothetical protein